jgi:hypothetical protein
MKIIFSKIFFIFSPSGLSSVHLSIHWYVIKNDYIYLRVSVSIRIETYIYVEKLIYV